MIMSIQESLHPHNVGYFTIVHNQSLLWARDTTPLDICSVVLRVNALAAHFSENT